MSRHPYLEHLSQFDDWNARAFLGILVAFGFPNSHLDVGCGTGAMVRTARRAGIDSLGIDVLVTTDVDIPGFINLDASQEFDLQRTFGLITCIEVAEHIRSDRVDVFVDNIVRHSANWCIVVWTAAAPGQGGENHQTLLPGHVWRSKFQERGFNYNESLLHRLRAIWLAVPMPMMWLPDNLQIFEKNPG